MKKNSILLILALGMMSCGFYNNVFATDGTEQTTESQERELTREDANILIAEMITCKSTKLVIPDEFTSIGRVAFKGFTCITSIDFNNVRSIGAGAFKDCKGITSIDFNNVTSIGEFAFSGCTRLTSIDFKSNTSIKECAFIGCTRLTSVDFKNVTSIGWCAFYLCTGLKSIVIPSSVTRIGFGAFAGCKQLSSITIPSTLERVEEDVFNDCENLKTVVITGDNLKGKKVNINPGPKKVNISADGTIETNSESLEALLKNCGYNKVKCNIFTKGKLGSQNVDSCLID